MRHNSRRRWITCLVVSAVLINVLCSCDVADADPAQREGGILMRTCNETAPSSGKRVLYPQDSGEILHNPGMGWVVLEEPLYPGRTTLGWQGDFPEADNISLSLSWMNVEPEDGVYDWSEVDKAIEYWTSLGKKINMRLVTDLNTIGYPVGGAPDWVGDRYGVPYTMEPVSDTLYARLYDLAHPEFIRLHDRFVTKFAARYRDNPDIDVIEIRAYGWFGEWHSSGNFKSLEERVNTLRHFLDVWKAEWGDKLFVVSASYEYNQQYVPYSVLDVAQSTMDDFAYVSAFDYAVQQGMAFRRDGIGAALHYWDEKLLTDTFKMNNRLPILGEHFGGYHVFLNRENGYDLMDFMSEALYKLHCSYLTAIGWVGEPFAEVTAPAEQGGSPDIVDFGNRYMGYRLIPHRLEYDAVVGAGGQLTLSQTWSNTAAGRAWISYPLKVYLTDSAGQEVWSGLDATFDPVLLTAGDLHWRESTFLLPEDLPVGEYDLRMAVVDAITGLPAIKLPIAGEDAQGRYFIDRIQVRDDLPDAQPKGTDSCLRPLGECRVVSDTEADYEYYGGIRGERYSGDILVSDGVLQPDTAYLIRFRYRSDLSAEDIRISSDERYLVEMRTATGEVLGQYSWRDVSAEPSERTILLRTQGEGCHLVWSLYDSCPLWLGDVQIQEMTGTCMAEDFEGDEAVLIPVESAGTSGVGEAGAVNGAKGFLVSTVGKGTLCPRTVQARSIPLKPNTAYYLSFQTRGVATSAGNYYFVDLRSGEETRMLCNWFERADFGAVNKTFHFVTGSEEEPCLEFGCYREGSFAVDDLILVEDCSGTVLTSTADFEEPRNQIRRPVFSGYPVTADFEGSSFHSSMLYPGVAHQGRFTLKAEEVISGNSSVLGKAWDPRDEWVNFLSSRPNRLPLSAGQEYIVRFDYRPLELGRNEEEGAWFQLCDASGMVVHSQPIVGVPGQVQTFVTTVRPEADNWTLQWSVYRSGSIVIDNVVISEAD